MEEKFYELLAASKTFNKWERVSDFVSVWKKFIDKELELHKLQVERDVLKSQLEAAIAIFDNPKPFPRIRIVPKPPAHNS